MCVSLIRINDMIDKELLVNDNELLVAAIEHAIEVANRHTDACGTDHANLARWLTELHEIRQSELFQHVYKSG